MAVIVGKISKKVVEIPREQKPTHRYFCDACTGIAFYWVEQGITPQTKFPKICQSCGKTLGPIKPINFIKL